MAVADCALAVVGCGSATLADEKGNALVVRQVVDGQWLERLLRPVCTAMGCSAGFCSRPLTGAQVRPTERGGRRERECVGRVMADEAAGAGMCAGEGGGGGGLAQPGVEVRPAQAGRQTGQTVSLEEKG